MGRTVFRCPRLLVDGAFIDDGALAVEDDTIVEAASWHDPPAGAEVVELSGLAVIPAAVNGHLHSFQSLLRGVADDLDLAGWRDALYRYTPLLTPDDVELAALFAYGEAALRGTGSVCDFFYLHHGDNERALRLVRAAETIGLRLAIARSMMDSEEAPASFRESPQQAVDNFRALRRSLEGHPLVTALPAPHSPHRASAAMVRAGAALAEEFDCPWHIHLAEASSEGNFTRERYGLTPLRWLESLGVLGPRCCLVHGVWLDDDEVTLVAAAGAKLIHCPSSNMFLGDGIAPLDTYLEQGVSVALGTDSGSASNGLSVFGDMRQSVLLQRVARAVRPVLRAGDAFAMGTTAGADITGLPLGTLAAGMKADFVALDVTAPSLLPATNLLSNIVYSLEQEAIREVYVGGRPIVADGSLTWRGASDLPRRLGELTNRLDLKP